MSGEGRIVVVGAHAQSVWVQVERVPKEGETVLGWGFAEPLDGGKAINQAVAAAKLGAPVSLISAFGSDARGERIREYLLATGIDLDYAIVTPGPTAVGFNLLPKSGVPAIVTAADRDSMIDEAVVARAAPLLEKASYVLAELEAPPEVAKAAFGIAHEHGAVTILNPAPAGPLEAALLRRTDVLIPNEYEAQALAGRAGSPADLAPALQSELGIQTVIVTAGSDGAFLASGGVVTHVAAPRVTACDTTGAGDAFIGALAALLREGHPLLAAVRFGVLYAARSVTRPGTLLAYPSRAEVQDDLAILEPSGSVAKRAASH